MSDRLRRTQNGVIIIGDRESDRVREYATVMCRHCGRHWVPRPGSGRVRGWCQNCAGPVCGPGCAACVPAGQYLDNIEAGRPADHRPIIVPGG